MDLTLKDVDSVEANEAMKVILPASRDQAAAHLALLRLDESRRKLEKVAEEVSGHAD